MALVNFGRCVAALTVWLLPVVALSHTAGAPLDRQKVQSVNCPPKSLPAFSHDTTAAPQTDSPWTCWYEGAPVHTLPLPTPAAVARAAHAGQVFAAETIEVTPLGTRWVRWNCGATGQRLYVPLAYCRRVAPENAAPGDLPIGRENLGPYDGLPADYCPSDLASVPGQYCFNDLPHQLRREARDACLGMLDAAQREAGLRIKVLSSYRSAQTQAYLCRQKILSAGIEQGDVARPGHSEHQLGTAVDLVGEDGLHLLNERFGSTREGRWLQNNCYRFGFVPSYSRQRAVREKTPYEPWHFRYVGREDVRDFLSKWHWHE